MHINLLVMQSVGEKKKGKFKECLSFVHLRSFLKKLFSRTFNTNFKCVCLDNAGERRVFLCFDGTGNRKHMIVWK